MILQGPHLTVATPLYQQPTAGSRNRQDTEPVDLGAIGESFIPRTNYQRAVPAGQFCSHYPRWKDEPSSSYFRLAWRAMADSAMVRTLHAALLPPGPTHVLGLFSLTADHRDLAVAGGFTSSLISDFLIKVMGVANIKIGVLEKLPHVRGHVLEQQLILRTLRLNCLIAEYAPLWAELFDPAWNTDAWVPGMGVVYLSRPALGDVTAEWTMSTPLRRDADRRQALVEIDAIVAVMLGITADELATIYHTQFPVLQSYESDALYDNLGRQVPRDIAKAYRKAQVDGRAFGLAERGGETHTYGLPFTGVDRDPDLRAAHAHFSRLVVGEKS